MVDLLKCLSGWPVTGKRGRKGAVSAEFRPGLDKRIHEGVVNLTRNILGRRVDDLIGNQDFDNLANNQMETGQSAGRKFNGVGIKTHDSVRMVQDKSRKRRRKIESIDIDASGDDSGSRIVKQIIAKCTYCDRTFKSFQAMGGHKRIHHNKPKEEREMMERKRKIESIDIDASGDDNCSRIVKQIIAKCTYCDRTFQSFQAMGGHKRVHHYKPKEKREMMEESEGAETKPEGENDADFTGSKIEVARMEWTSDKHNKKDGRISDSYDINELDLNIFPKFVSDRENGAKRAPDATTARKGMKKQERRRFDLNRSPNSPP